MTFQGKALCDYYIHLNMFWPQGKVEMTIEILAGYEAAAKPAGQGRDDPNQHPVLEEPK